jgi:hypothetical protein
MRAAWNKITAAARFPNYRNSYARTAAAAAQTYSYTGTGGIIFAGAAGTARTRAYPANAAGLVFAGTAGRNRTRAYPTAGGLTFAGTGATTRTWTYTPSGGLTLSGSAATARTLVYPASGGLSFGGTAPIARTRVGAQAGGGVTLGGTGATAREWVGLAAGGVQFGGSATTSFTSAGPATHDYTGTGGLVFGGSAATAFVPARPVPTPDTGGGFIPGLWVREPFQKPARKGRTGREYVYAGSGGLVLGGLALVAFVPGPVRVAPRPPVPRRTDPRALALATGVPAAAFGG